MAQSTTDADLRSHPCERDQRYPLHDARGIFCCFVCSKCEGAKKQKFRADIFTDGSYWHDEPIDED